MWRAVDQAGAYAVAAYCAYTLYALLWFKVEPVYGLWISLVAAAPIVLVRARQALRVGPVMGAGELLILLIVATSCLSLVLQRATLLPAVDENGVEALDFTVRMLVNNMIWLLVGASVALSSFERSWKWSLVCVVVFAVPLVANIGDDFVLDYFLITRDTALERFGLSHLAIAEFVVLLFFFAYALAKRLRPLLVVCAVLALFAAGGRTSLYLGTSSVLAYEIGTRNLRGKAQALATAALVGVLVWGVVSSDVLDFDSSAVQEMLFLGGMEEDDSYEGRQEIVRFSLLPLVGQWLYGNPVFIVERFGYIGSYIHNLLSGWQFFGAPFFVLVVVVLYRSVRGMMRIAPRSNDPTDAFGALVLIYAVVSVVLSKYIGFYFLWLAMGFWTVRGAAPLRRPHRRRSEVGFVIGRRRRRRTAGVAGRRGGSGHAGSGPSPTRPA